MKNSRYYIQRQETLYKGENKMNPYKYFALINKQKNKITELIMSPVKPDVENSFEVIELTEQTYCDLAYGDAW
jgi:hypothetical protein